MKGSERPELAATHVHQGELWCDGVSLAEIGDVVGTPCYIYSDAVIRNRFTAFTTAFDDVDHRIFYSVKANHNIALLKTLRELGAGADVVSVGELHRAKMSWI